MEWMLMPLKKYADFSGRSRRQEYWMYMLLNLIVYVIGFAFILAGMPWDQMGSAGMAQAGDYGAANNAPPGPLFWVGVIFLGLWVLGTFIPSLAVAVRRFHDQDKSGWMYLLSFIPYVGGIILLVFMCLEGTRGPNRYGPDPKGNGVGDIFS